MNEVIGTFITTIYSIFGHTKDDVANAPRSSSTICQLRRIFSVSSPFSSAKSSQPPQKAVKSTMATNLTSLSSLVEAASALADLPAKSGAGATASESQTKVPTTASSLTGKLIFPQKLHSVLNDSSLSDIITWLPHGRSFVIIRPDVFAEKVMPTYFPSPDARTSTKYPSFTRKLNRW